MRLHNSSRNGTAKCSSASEIATACQPGSVRCTNQGVSSVRFPDQMIRNCEKLVYAHRSTKANIRFPRSWKCPGARKRENGSRFCSHDEPTIANASVESTCPTIRIAGYIVEYQRGSSDIAQSIAAKVIARQ